MQSALDRVTGAHLDVSELEYVAALLQTDRHCVRSNGSVRGEDVRTYLKSRHGIDASLETVRRLLVGELAAGGGGRRRRRRAAPSRARTETQRRIAELQTSLHGKVDRNGDDDNEKKKENGSFSAGTERGSVMDLCQFVSIILIPALVEAAAAATASSSSSSSSDDDDEERRASSSSPLLFRAFREEVLGGAREDRSGSSPPLLLSVERLRVVMERVHGCANDDDDDDELLRDMVAAATTTGGGGGTEEQAVDLVAALTADTVGAWNAEWETRPTTHYHDVVRDGAATAAKEEDATEPPSSLRRVHTLPAVDYVADTYRRPAYVMVLWTCGVATFFAYVMRPDEQGNWLHPDCETSESRSGTNACQIATGVATWFALLIQLVVLGVAFVLGGSLGGSVYVTERNDLRGAVFLLLCSAAVLVMFTIYPYYAGFETAWYSTYGNKESEIDCQGDSECEAHCAENPCWEKYDNTNDIYGATYYLSITLGILLLISRVVDIVYILLPLPSQVSSKLHRYVMPGSIKMEQATKQAAAFKVNRMINNALELLDDDLFTSTNRKKTTITNKATTSHGSSPVSKSCSNSESNNARNDTMTPSQTSLERFTYLPKEKERVGGMLWTWKKIFDGTLFAEEGIWFHSRLLACNFAQLTVIGFVIFVAFVLFKNEDDIFYSNQERAEKQAYEAASSRLGTYYTDEFQDLYREYKWCVEDTVSANFTFAEYFDVQNDDVITAYFLLTWIGDVYGNLTYALASPELAECFDERGQIEAYLTDTETVSSYKGNFIKDFVDDNELTRRYYRLAVTVGLLGGFFVALSVFVVFIPSFVSTVLKFRSGIIPSLGDREFLRFRYALDVTTVLFGSAFWGALFSATAAIFVLVGIVLLFVVATYFIGTIIGFFLVLGFKVIVLLFLRSLFFSAFYRRRPAAANVMFLVLEVWNIGLSVGFVIIRALKLVCIMIFYLARIDTPFLAPGVGRLGPVELDGYALAFRKDLLLHDAHRHPLIERFGQLCLLKLRCGSRFATRAGSAWRLLFVMMLFPWLRRYRITSSYEEDIEEIIAEIELELAEEKDPTRRGSLQKDLASAMEVKRVLERKQQAAMALPRNSLEEENEMLRRRVEELEHRLNSVERRLSI